MQVTTSSGNTYFYNCRTNAVSDTHDEGCFSWQFAPLKSFDCLPNLDTFIIGLTEQCNLRCSYCCYSGKYPNNRSHSHLVMDGSDIAAVLDFINDSVSSRTPKIAFYGGEPLLQYTLLQSTVEKIRSIWESSAEVSISTNGVLLSKERIDWLVTHNVRIDISIDGTEEFHDRYRIQADGKGSFKHVIAAIEYLKATYPEYIRKGMFLLMTVSSISDIGSIAEKWNANPILRDLSPTKISEIAPNFNTGVAPADYDLLVQAYLDALKLYEEHPEWNVLKAFFEQSIAMWKERPIMDVIGEVPMSTCLPITNKLFIASDLQIGVCEKMADKYRIGDALSGVDYRKANALVKFYYDQRVDRCVHCQAVRMCNLCLSAVEYTSEQWDTLCHNELVYMKTCLRLFCEMAEKGMVV